MFVEAGAVAARAVFPARRRERLARDASTARSRPCAAAVGVCDVSTLGKIDIQGADAAEFLDRVYVNGWTVARRSAARATA